MGLFPDLDPQQILDNVAARWDLSGPFPIPLGDWLACPVCRSAEVQPRYWEWVHLGAEHSVRARCNVSFKCVACSAVWVHGVALQEDYYRRNAVQHGRVGWREVRKHLAEAGTLGDT